MAKLENVNAADDIDEWQLWPSPWNAASAVTAASTVTA
ncbi:hypothetical protein LINPERHAP1_LOCUS1407, partial [Linum perenne]